VTYLVTGLRDVQAAFARADRESRVGLARDFQAVAEPVRREAETLALSRIRRMPHSPAWARMRTGRTLNVIYVAPRQRGVTTRGPDPRHRPNLANLMMERAMQPALEHNEPQIERATEAILDRVAAGFNH
jgi:hypothetical protein